MKTLIRLEEFAKMFFAYWLSIEIGYAWWVFFAWLLVPDLSMIGYVINTKVGAWIYNFVHHQAVAIVIGIIGFYLDTPALEFSWHCAFRPQCYGQSFWIWTEI
jgi:hypothetical protein